MKITKYDHSGFYLEENGRGLLFDPVEQENKLPEFNNIDVIIITHKHGDHFQSEVVERIRQKNPEAKIFTTNDNASAIAGATAVKPGDKMTVGEFSLEFFGSYKHAPIYRDEVPCENVGVIVDGKVVNSGDSFDIPELNEVAILLVPLSAPWLKTDESIKYIEDLRPKFAINTHDALLSEMGVIITNNWLFQKSAPVGTEYKYLKFNESLEI